ncbi:hypothetical protein SAMN05421858_5102 [Haladaptatus litoreus]|uniref:Uncharacterized protein n=1 Tax=Haladaptatus litoreus TaxID=553468 RepID=A0A1N7FIK1_9EURY|nr:hypothetical protein [Haladaptatus litoreus]SIS00179.1 hypothetical protein SAMN05421858_5102 [Haladaptatus litoreus]
MSKEQTQTPTVAPNPTIDCRKAIFNRLDVTNLPREVLIESVVGGENYGQDFVERQLNELRKVGEIYTVPMDGGEWLEVRRT